MAVKLFRGHQFEHEHEWNQFKEIYNQISEKYSESTENIYLLSNLIVSDAQIDVVILTEKGPAILELKSWKGEIIGKENGTWMVIDREKKEVELPNNLYRQLLKQRYALASKLIEIKREVRRNKELEFKQKGNLRNINDRLLKNVKIWGYFEKGSSYNPNQIDRKLRILFDVITAEGLLEKLNFLNSKYLLRLEDMELIVEALGLEEYSIPEQVKVETKHEKKISPQPYWSEKLESLLQIDKMQWVQNDLLPLLGLLNYCIDKEKYVEIGLVFTLPRSKENLIFNLERISHKHNTIITRLLSEFEEQFKEYIIKQEKNYTYRARYSKKSHPPRRPCPNPFDSTKNYIFKPELIEQSEIELSKISVNLEKNFHDTLFNVRSIEDLIYVTVLKKICALSLYSSSKYCFGDADSGFTEPLRTTMEIAEIDPEFIDYFLGYDRFKLIFDKMEVFLPTENRLFSVFYSHRFNTNSCVRWINIVIRKDLALFLFEQLEKIDFEVILKEHYVKIKERIKAQEEKLPLLHFRDSYKLLKEYSDKRKKGKKFFVFKPDKMIDYLRDKGIIKIENDEVVLLSEEKFDTIYWKLEKGEKERIERNKEELYHRWLRGSVKLVS